MKLEEYENKKRKTEIVILVIITLLIIAIGISYAFWILTKKQTGENIVNTSCLNVTIENEIDDIKIDKAYPILDEEGLNSKPYKFSIKNNCEEYADYKISLEMLSETTLNSEYVSIALSEEGDKGVATLLSEYKEVDRLTIDGAKEGRQIKRGKLKPSEEKSYELRIWIDEDVTIKDDAMNKIYKSKIVVESVLGDKPYTESILNGTDPVLDGDLIPIKINEEDGSVTRADETKKWYSYGEQQWANAVILRDGIEDPGANEPIEENDIESYFVWIPRYRYEIFDEGNYVDLGTKESNEQIINIEFESKYEEAKKGTSEGQWLTHPAFTSFNTNGIWVGKFETGYDGAENTKAAEVNPADETATIEAVNKVIIKPNMYSWRGIQLAKAYTVGRHYEESLNSHMMKNTEWGAVAYLQHSKYGSHIRVRINNNSDYITGYAARQEPTTGYTETNELCSNTPDACNEYGGVSKPADDGEYNTNYFNKASVVASTTKNYSGIYDMSGGAWEYMMTGMDDGTGNNKLLSGRHSNYNSGFNGSLSCPSCSGGDKNIFYITDGIPFPNDNRYYDKYEYDTTDINFSRGILGDATKEMGPFQSMKYLTKSRQTSSWYDGEAWLCNNLRPFFRRGGSYRNGIGSSITSFSNDAGQIFDYDSFRLVLAF